MKINNASVYPDIMILLCTGLCVYFSVKYFLKSRDSSKGLRKLKELEKIKKELEELNDLN